MNILKNFKERKRLKFCGLLLIVVSYSIFGQNKNEYGFNC